ncbi:MAG: hypothetical protein ACLQGV_04580 [Bryobacteraceae bacterium]
MTGTRYCHLIAVAWFTLAGCSAIVCGQDKVDGWTIEYQAKALRVESVQELGTEPNTGVDLGVSVKLGNVSGRVVTGYAIGLGSPEGTVRVAVLKDGLQPDASFDFRLSFRPGTPRVRIVRVAAVLFGDRAADDGEPATIEEMRLNRLGEFLEYARCSKILDGLDSSPLDDASVQAVTKTLNQMPIEAVLLVSLPGPPQLQASKRVSGASPEARRSLISGVDSARHILQRDLKDLMRLPATSATAPAGQERAQQYAKLKRDHEKLLARLQALAVRDEEVEQWPCPDSWQLSRSSSPYPQGGARIAPLPSRSLQTRCTAPAASSRTLSRLPFPTFTLRMTASKSLEPAQQCPHA